MKSSTRPVLHLGSVLPEHAPLQTSRGAHAGRPGLVLGLELSQSSERTEVWAEASPLPNFGAASDAYDRARGELLALDESKVASWLEAPYPDALDRLFDETQDLSSGAARQAIEWVTLQALARLWQTGPAELALAWLRRRSPTSGWSGPRQVLAASAVLDPLAPDLHASASALGHLGVRTWKLKCGRDAQAELAALHVLARTGAVARIRLDPGCVFSQDQALDFVRRAQEACASSTLTLELVEDPTPDVDEWAAIAALVPVAADEVLGRAVQPPPVDATRFWVLKPMVHGIGGFLQLALEGRRRGQLLLASHTFDGPLALCASTELACAVQAHEHAPGLGRHPALGAWDALSPDGAELLRGRRAFPEALGGGVLLDGPRMGRVLRAASPRPPARRAPRASGAPEHELAPPRGDGLSIVRAAQLFGEQAFLDLPAGALSFAELERQVQEAPALEGSSLVPILAEPNVAAIVRLLQALEEGAPALLLHPSAPSEARQRLVARARAHQTELRPGDAVVVPTSGSTAEPHLVVHTRASLLGSVSASAARLGAPTPSTRWLLSLPFAHVGGLSILLRCLAAGACVVVQPLPKVPSAVARLLVDQRVTHVSLVPTQLRRLLDDPAFRFPPCVECVLVGGAQAPASLRQRAAERGAPISYTYGLTEMGSQVATQAPEARAREPLRCDVGAPLAGITLATSEAGALRVGGPMAMRAYLGEVAALEGGLFTTTDAVEIDESSRLVVQGRLDDVIISGGENVAPAAVEAVLLEVPGVLEACVLGRPSAEWGQEVVAVVVPRPDAEQRLLEALAQAASTHLPAYARPKTYRLLPSLPLLDSGKVDRRRLAADL